MYLASLLQWQIRLIAYGIAAAIGLVAALVIQRAGRNAKKPSRSVQDVKRDAETVTGVTVAVFGLIVVTFAAILVLARAPLWTLALLIPVALWAGWWLPPRNRMIHSQASIVVQGLPTRVSAFVADAPGHVKWSPGVVSCVPELQGPRGPRFRTVEQTPAGQQIGGVIERTRDEPGVEVDFLLEGTGATGDYYGFAAQPAGTMVTKKTVIQLPYMVALAGGMLMATSDAPNARQRRVTELQALKSAFELGQ